MEALRQLEQLGLQTFLFAVAALDYFVIDSMIRQLWSKQAIVEVQLSEDERADWAPSLPLFFRAQWNHYVGFYHQLIMEFYSSFQPFPYSTNSFWLEEEQSKTTLIGTEIVSHLFAIFSQKHSQPLKLICHFRGRKDPIIDLKRFYKNSLKASTCIRYGKFGSSVITVDMTVSNIDDMFQNFKKGEFQPFLGSSQSQATNLGYRFIVERPQKIESTPIRILGKDIVLQRKIPKTTLLHQFWSQLSQNQLISLTLHGVELAEMEISFVELQRYCHPDGFLYFTIS